MSFLTGTQAELLYAMPATGGAVTGTLSTGSAAGGPLLTPVNSATAAAYQLPAYFFSTPTAPGKSLLVQGGGTLLNGAATQTMRFALYLNATEGTVGTLLCATGLFSPFGTTVSQTGTFMFECLITCTAVGTTTGTLNAVGRLAIGPSANTATNVGSVTMLMNSSTQPTFNSTVPQFIEAYAHFGATTTTQAATLTNFYVWGLN